jgi:lysophospholipase L1-like esterase
MRNFLSKYKWYIVGAISLVGLGVATAYAIDKITIVKNKNPKKLLFVGDSITTGDSAYPSKIRSQKSDLQVDTLSQVGKNTSWMLDNLKTKLASNKYDRVYIYGGINDVFSSVPIATILSNIQEMVDLINENGADAFVIEGYDIDGFMDYQKMPVTQYVSTKQDYLPLIEKYKQYQNNIANTIKNANFVKPINLGTKTSDGIHPNGEGQQIIATEILKTI